MTEKGILKIFKEKDALLKGHFKLSSGLHSEKYLQCALVLQYPDIAEKLSKALAKKFAKENIDIVIGPALGGITLAYEVARAIGAKGIFAERQDGRMSLRRGFSVEKGDKVLVVEDVITTGGSAKEVMGLVKDSGGRIVGVGAIVDRSGGKTDFGARFEALAKIDIETIDASSCPLCKKGIPVTKPGSRK